MLLLLELGALSGLPVRTDEIEMLTRASREAARVEVRRDDDGDPPA